MIVKDLITGNVLQSDNDFVIQQWLKNKERYTEIKNKKTKVS